MSCNCNNKALWIFRGDDTDFDDEKKINLTINTTVDMTGWLGYFTVLGVVKTLTNLVSGVPNEIVFTSAETATFPIGLTCATFKLVDAEGRKRTFLSSLPVNVTGCVPETEYGNVVDCTVDDFNILINTELGVDKDYVKGINKDVEGNIIKLPSDVDGSVVGLASNINFAGVDYPVGDDGNVVIPAQSLEGFVKSLNGGFLTPNEDGDISGVATIVQCNEVNFESDETGIVQLGPVAGAIEINGFEYYPEGDTGKVIRNVPNLATSFKLNSRASVPAGNDGIIPVTGVVESLTVGGVPYTPSATGVVALPTYPDVSAYLPLSGGAMITDSTILIPNSNPELGLSSSLTPYGLLTTREGISYNYESGLMGFYNSNTEMSGSFSWPALSGGNKTLATTEDITSLAVAKSDEGFTAPNPNVKTLTSGATFGEVVDALCTVISVLKTKGVL